MDVKASVIFSEKRKGDEKGYLHVLYRRGAERTKVSLEFTLTREQFEDLYDKRFQRFIPTKKIDYKSINERIEVNLKRNPFDNKKTSYTFLSYFEYKKSMLSNHSTINIHNTCLANLKIYLSSIGRKDIRFEDFDNDFILRMRSYFKQKGLQDSSLRLYLNTYSAIFNSAAKDNIYTQVNPFYGHKIKVIGKPKKILTEQDIKALQAIKPTDGYFIESRMFLFSFLGNGLRCSDMMLLKNSNFTNRNAIEYIQMKTGTSMKLNYNTQLVKVILDVIGMGDLIEKLKQSYEGYFDNLTYNECIRKIYAHIGAEGYLDKLESDTLLSPDSPYEKYKGFVIKKSDEEIKNLIGYSYSLLREISVTARMKIVEYFKKQNPDELLFKDFIKSNIFNGYDKKQPFTKEQFDLYKSKFTSYNAKIKRMSKKYDLTLPNPTTHSARFTFTNILLTMDSINLNDIRIALSHTNLATTQKYLQTGFDFKKSDALNERLNSIFE
ncbi:phage integrase SAM-like domain-containing protein [Flavobacterium selenitireducens]|uniref:phage integrase SAM-like domain-containing protein n=1 Tax=Flavobacterium selenitireducens TaxID=2722704 RepID=UPI00168B578D|nr:phage integrase SAM-like domain-containing protein [Flavobacterium selenitireducens]